MDHQFPTLDVSVETVTASVFKRRLDNGEEWTLLDTRRPADFEQWKPEHPNLTTINVPFTAFLDGDQPAGTVPSDVPREPLVTCCAKGISSLFVAKFLAREGWDVLALDNGMEGWAELYECREVETDGATTVYQFHRPSSGCLAYLFVSGNDAAVIDPLRAFASEYQRVASDAGASVRYVIDTHVHADHVSGLQRIADALDVEPVMPAGATERGLTFDARLLDAGDTLALGETEIEAVGLPGHTTEMTGYRCDSVLATGDTVFLDSVARPDLEDEAKAREAAGTLWDTLQELTAYPDETVIAPGHAGSTTTPRHDGTFTSTLSALQIDALEMSRDTFVEESLATLPPRPNNFEQIIAVNLGRETVSDQSAFELELGPNNCAVDG
jgi:glyoxylase-like metal-dependent hydrolase (beta-lactamase superfamily II)/rhodanese-related sulfurtransferase